MSKASARITCPECHAVTAETMPQTYCLWVFDCPACGTRLTPRPGDCCVFCSYGDQRCPPKQAEDEPD
ncbi:GDCCVxC domain-containing (seleno)protein [Ferruginivarius sediminum]|uniref:Uncharacterized protein n=1 Tax=Ferruginivarius sediminum TaxID=2661937 RepID=A0A369T9F8_9PROT|nr:GDCCVxC domain-containing (seleno)protein [Ferruginivarius sediminum]RDD60807.1 hypothetical protein DRB17_16430 [Ferruginivarius sediminum]